MSLVNLFAFLAQFDVILIFDFINIKFTQKWPNAQQKSTLKKLKEHLN